MNISKESIYGNDSNLGLFVSTVLLGGLAFGLYKGVQDNYLAEIVRITEFERGIVEFFRELPGLLLIFILAAMYRFSETNVFKVGTAVMLVGVLGLLLSGSSKVMVILFMVVFSTGEHVVMPIKSSMSLALARKDKGGTSLGITSAIGKGGNILGYLVVSIIFLVFSRLGFSRRDTVAFKTVYALAAALLVGSTLVALAMKESGRKVKRSRLYFRRKFLTFYLLEVFYGARKQIFLTFAPYVLILVYGATTTTVSLLLALCSLFGMLLSPAIGRIIDRLGYKVVMVADTLILVAVCLLYGFAHRLFPLHIAFCVVAVNFILDSIISLASMASNVYVMELSDDREELTATLTTGISVNHFISVIIALLGGLIWKTVGIEVLFSVSAVLGVINSIFAATITTPDNSSPQSRG
ncbi:MAG: MFS transporter [Spirochaetales bacterium]|nr:MFS transporter [Spirochaetales bacterium]